jgi:hypothetical protein
MRTDKAHTVLDKWPVLSRSMPPIGCIFLVCLSPSKITSTTHRFLLCKHHASTSPALCRFFIPVFQGQVLLPLSVGWRELNRKFHEWTSPWGRKGRPFACICLWHLSAFCSASQRVDSGQGTGQQDVPSKSLVLRDHDFLSGVRIVEDPCKKWHWGGTWVPYHWQAARQYRTGSENSVKK